MPQPKAIVLDVDGVLKRGSQVIPYAVAFIDALNRRNFPYRLMTNCPFIDRDKMTNRLLRLGLQIPLKNILGSADPLADVLQRLKLTSQQVFSIGIEDPAPHLRQFGLEANNNLPAHQLGAVILFDDDFWWTAERVATVFNLLLDNEELPLIIPNPDLIFPHDTLKFMLTSGAIGSLLKTLCEAKGRKLEPIYLGKPYLPLFTMTKNHLRMDIPELKSENIIMIGDTPATDLLGANRAGWTSWLVKTGGYRYGAEDPEAKPDKTFQDLKECLEFLAL